MAGENELDLSEIFSNLDSFVNDKAESLARSIGVAASFAIGDKAKELALQAADNQAQYGVHRTGEFADAINSAYSQRTSTTTQFVYNVQWNHAKFGFGFMLEFGHWRYPVAHGGTNSERGGDIFKSVGTAGISADTKGKRKKDAAHTDKMKEAGALKWVPAYPVLLPALNASKDIAFTLAIEAGRRKFSEIMK